MAYAALADIQNEFKATVFSPQSTPTDSQVNIFIADAQAEIDARVGTRYQVPVTGTNSLVSIKRICVWLVAARVKGILKLKSDDPQLGQTVRAGDLRAMALKDIADIASGQYLLADAVQASSAQGLQGFGVGAGETLQFDKDTQQW